MWSAVFIISVAVCYYFKSSEYIFWIKHIQTMFVNIDYAEITVYSLFLSFPFAFFVRFGFWLDRDVFEENINKKMRKAKTKTKKDFQTNKKKPLEHRELDVFVGYDINKKPFFFPFGYLNYSGLIAGASGSGKTTTLMNFLDYAQKRNIKTIVINGKGSNSFNERVKKIYSNPCFVSILKKERSFNPFFGLNNSEKLNLLMQLSDFTEPFYKNKLIAFLLPVVSKFHDFGKFLDYAVTDQENMGNLYGVFVALKELDIWDQEKLINLSDDFDCLLFELAALQQPETTQAVGRLLLAAIKNHLGAKLFNNDKSPVFLIFEECSVYFSDVILNVINQGREAGAHTLLTTQALADLKKLHPELFRQVVGSCSNYIVQRLNDPDEAEYMAGLIGTDDYMDFTFQVDDDGSTGLGSARQTQEYIVHPNDIKNFKIGQGIVLSKVDGALHYININKEIFNDEKNEENEENKSDAIINDDDACNSYSGYKTAELRQRQ